MENMFKVASKRWKNVGVVDSISRGKFKRENIFIFFKVVPLYGSIIWKWENLDFSKSLKSGYLKQH